MFHFWKILYIEFWGKLVISKYVWPIFEIPVFETLSFDINIPLPYFLLPIWKVAQHLFLNVLMWHVTDDLWMAEFVKYQKYFLLKSIYHNSSLSFNDNNNNFKDIVFPQQTRLWKCQEHWTPNAKHWQVIWAATDDKTKTNGHSYYFRIWMNDGFATLNIDFKHRIKINLI